MARGDRRDPRSLFPAERPKAECGRSEGLRRGERGRSTRRSATASVGTRASHEEAEPAHVALHANGAFESLPPQAPGRTVLRARARRHLRGAGRACECAKVIALRPSTRCIIISTLVVAINAHLLRRAKL